MPGASAERAQRPVRRSRPIALGAETPEQVLDRLDLTIVRRLEGLLQGGHRTLFRGGGVDFTDLRGYQPEDDTRHIDWNVTARMNETFVRRFDEDRDLTVWFLIDRTASMRFGGDPDKVATSAHVVITLARLLTRQGNHVGARFWDGGVESIVEPGTGRRHVLRLADEMLSSVAPTATAPAAEHPNGSPTRLAGLGEHALRSLRRRSLVIVVSDFISEPGWERPFALLARRHDVVALRLVDPAETELPSIGIMVMQDAETGEQIVVDTGDAAFRQRFLRAAAERTEAIATQARRARIDLHTVGTSDDIVRALLRVAARRKHLRR